MTALLARPVRERRLKTPAGQPRENQKTAIVQRENARELLDDFLGNRRLKGRSAEVGWGESVLGGDPSAGWMSLPHA